MFLNIKMFRRKHIYWCIFIATCIYLYLRFNREPSFEDLLNERIWDNLTCHYSDKDDALPIYDARVFKPEKKSIFFHDTSCKGTLNSRQICAIESAARSNSNREIYVFFSGPVSEYTMYTNLAVLENFSNVHLARIHIENYATGTAIENLLMNGILNKTQWGIENMSNVLRFLTLYRWSGVYLDMDVVVVKSFDNLPSNWIAREDKYMVNAAAIALSNDDVGRYFAEAFIEELVTNYKPNIWSHNGPGAVTRVLKRVCDTKDVTQMSRETCYGFSVLQPSLIYPIHYTQKSLYFKPGYRQDTSQAYVFHMWNRLTNHMPIQKDSLYYNLAKEFCPSVYGLYGDKFGS